jgi:hypothetical protein
MEGMPMGQIKITVEGMPFFSWDGDEASVASILSDFPRAAEHAGLTPRKFAESCLWHVRSGKTLARTPEGEEMQMMGVIWLVLTSDTRNSQHPGKIADYVPTTDFAVDFNFDGNAVGWKVEATSRLHS